MASPFRVFRRYQKALLVVAGVVLMFVFVIGDSLMQSIGSAPGAGERAARREPRAVAVRWDNGRLTNAELDSLVMQRRVVNEFVRQIEFAGRRVALEAGVDPLPLRVEMIAGPEMPEQGVEQDVVRMKVFAEAARERGMHLSNEHVVHYLDELGRQQVSRDEMREVMSRMQLGGRRASADYILDALREELLARNYLASYQFALETVTPQQRWQDWLRVNDRVIVEAAALPVESFVINAPEPSDAELAEFFELYRQREPQPDLLGATELPSRHPGFAIPRKIEVRTIRANYDEFLEKVEDEITDEEIEKYYEDNKDPYFIRADRALIEDSGITTEGQPLDATDEAADEASAEETEFRFDFESALPDVTSEDEAAAGASDDSAAPADGAAPGVDSATESTESTESSEASEATESSESSQEAESAEPAATDGSQLEAVWPGSVFQLTAYLQAAEEDGAADLEDAEGGQTEATGNEAAESGSVDAGSTGAAEVPAGASPVSEEPVSREATDLQTIPAAASPADSAEAAPAGSDESSAAVDEPAAPSAESPVEFQSLDEVRDLIRRELAEQKVTEQLIALMEQLQSQLRTDFNRYFGERLDAEAQGLPRPTPPAALADLESLAQQHGLQYETTGHLSALELSKLPMGMSVGADNRTPLVLLLFSRDIEPYQPVSTFDLDGNRYLSMKIDDVPGRIPTLDEVGDEVVSAWKLQKAAELALKKAEELAGEASKSEVPLSEFFAEDQTAQLVTTDPFAWLTGGSVSRLTGRQQPFRISEPDGIVAAGPEFMRAVFDLGENEVGAVLNHDHSMAYVIRVADRLNTKDQLRQFYLAEANSWDGLVTMIRGHMQQSAQVLVRDVLDDAGVDWGDRIPDARPEETDQE